MIRWTETKHLNLWHSAEHGRGFDSAVGWELVSQESATPAALTGAVVGDPGFALSPASAARLFKRRVQ
jgi:hypothetical protein